MESSSGLPDRMDGDLLQPTMVKPLPRGVPVSTILLRSPRGRPRVPMASLAPGIGFLGFFRRSAWHSGRVANVDGLAPCDASPACSCANAGARGITILKT